VRGAKVWLALEVWWGAADGGMGQVVWVTQGGGGGAWHADGLCFINMKTFA